jgi:hypothetical protein
MENKQKESKKLFPKDYFWRKPTGNESIGQSPRVIFRKPMTVA